MKFPPQSSVDGRGHPIPWETLTRQTRRDGKVFLEEVAGTLNCRVMYVDEADMVLAAFSRQKGPHRHEIEEVYGLAEPEVALFFLKTAN